MKRQSAEALATEMVALVFFLYCVGLAAGLGPAGGCCVVLGAVLLSVVLE